MRLLKFGRLQPALFVNNLKCKCQIGCDRTSYALLRENAQGNAPKDDGCRALDNFQVPMPGAMRLRTKAEYSRSKRSRSEVQRTGSSVLAVGLTFHHSISMGLRMKSDWIE
jgi:hypothetical protein